MFRMITRKWCTVRKTFIKASAPITALDFIDKDSKVLGISTCCAYEFVPVSYKLYTKAMSFFWILIKLFVVAMIARYLIIRFKLI